MEIQSCEKTGPNFSLDTYLAARKTCIEAVNTIIKKIEPGTSEKVGQSLIKEVFKDYDVKKFWHPSKFRISTDTVKGFSETPDHTLLCEEGDICYLDVGPIINQHEADYGRSFVIGNGSRERHALVQASETIFLNTAKYWKQERKSGKDLFEFANDQAISLGYVLNPKMAGHRLGDFPHKVFSSEKLFKFQQVPVENLWVLEIHVIDESNQRGAFFEDILY